MNSLTSHGLINFVAKVDWVNTSITQLMITMKNNSFYIMLVFIVVLMVTSFSQSGKITELEIRVNELSVIVDQKFLPAMILDDLKVK